jgi:predicted MFS family arabinose efflux permease
MTWLSEKLKSNRRIEICAWAQVWALIFLIPLVCFPNSESAWTRYAILTLLLGYPYIHAIQVALQSRNANSVRTRTVASAAYNMMVQLGNIVSSNIYRANDAPYYRKGNKILIGIACLNLVLYAIAKVYYLWKNKKRERIWNSWTEEQRKEYLTTTKDRGNKRIDFRFAH